MDKFTKKGLLENNLEMLWKLLIQQKNKDLTILVVGGTGTGKSSLSMLMAKWADENLSDVQFSEDHVAWLHSQWMDKEEDTLPQKAFSWYDEGRNTFNRRKAMHSENKEGLDHLSQYRYRNLMRTINFQNTFDMEKALMFNVSHVVIRVVKQGWAHVYSQQSIQSISFDDDKGIMNWHDPDLRFSFPDAAQVLPDMWERYENARKETMDNRRNKEKGDSQRTVTCQKCDYSWNPRVDVPTQCPNCNTRNWNPRM